MSVFSPSISFFISTPEPTQSNESFKLEKPKKPEKSNESIRLGKPKKPDKSRVLSKASNQIKRGSKKGRKILNNKPIIKNKRVRRSVKNKRKNLKIFSANADGLQSKINSFKSQIEIESIDIFTIQETHFKKKGRLSLQSFNIYETIRDKTKGGSMMGVHSSLESKLIAEYSGEFELLVVEVKIAKKSIRFITGYGPQENLKEDERRPFFAALEKEIINANINGCSVFIEIDANSKLGRDFIPT